LEYLGFPDVDGARPSLCVSFRFIDGLPLSKTLKTLDLSGWNYCFPSPFDSLPFSFFGHFSNLECLLLPQQKMPWNYFKFTSATPSSVTNLNLIANVNLDQFRGIFGANFGKKYEYVGSGVSSVRSLAFYVFENDIANPTIIEQLSCIISNEMVHYFDRHSEKMVLSRLTCIASMAMALGKESDPKLKLPSSLKELIIDNQCCPDENHVLADIFSILPPALEKFNLTHHAYPHKIRNSTSLGHLPRSLVELRLDLGVRFCKLEDFERLPATLTDLSLVICDESNVDPEWAASVPLDVVFLPQLRRLFLVIECDRVNASFLVRHWMSPTLQSLTLQGAISVIPNFEIPGCDMRCHPNTTFTMQLAPTLYDRPLLTKLAIHTNGIDYNRIQQFLPSSLTHFTYTTDMNRSKWLVGRPVSLTNRIFKFLPSKLLHLELGLVSEDMLDGKAIPRAIQENPFFNYVYGGDFKYEQL